MQKQVYEITPVQAKKFVKTSGLFYRMFYKPEFCENRKKLDRAIRKNICVTKEYVTVEDKLEKKRLDKEIRRSARIHIAFFRVLRVLPIEEFYLKVAKALNDIIKQKVHEYAYKNIKSSANTHLPPNH